MRTPKFQYYLTTRGLNAEGGILSLDYIPKSFHPYITVVCGAEFRKSILKKYPELGGYWANDPDVTTASGKRKWIFENSPVDDFFLINAETRFYTEVGDGKARAAHTSEEHFFRNVCQMEDLTNYYVGVAANQKPFSNGFLKSQSMIHENYVISAWFYWNRKFAAKHIEFDRVNYLDDCDYVLQAMYKGYRVCNFAGILYEHRTHVPQRQFSDRTESVQERDTKKLLKMHPECISRKPDYNPEVENIGVSIKFSKAYKPVKSVTLVYSKKTEELAMAAFLALMKFRKNYQIRAVSLDLSPKDKNPAGIAPKLFLKKLRLLGLPSRGIDGKAATARTVNVADDILFFDGEDRKRARAMFPRIDPSKMKAFPSIVDIKSMPEEHQLELLISTARNYK